MCLGQNGLGYFLLLLCQYEEKKLIVSNTLYPSMEKEKVKYGEKKWVIWHDMKGERERKRLQINAADVEPKFL